MLQRPTEEDAQGHLETWFIAPSGNYRDTLSWLAVLTPSDYPLYLDQVATMAEVPKELLDKEVQQRRRVLDGTYQVPGAHSAPPAHAPNPHQPAPAPAPPSYVQPHPPHAAPMPSTALVPHGAGQLAVYTCRSCGTTGPTMIRSRVSTGGWIVFAILFLTCALLSFIPIISMRESFPACGRCRRQLT